MEKKLSKKALTKSFHNWYYGHLTCFSQEHMQTFGYLCSMLPLVEELYDKLSLSEGTVRNSLSMILSKLELRDRTQLAIWAVQTGVINQIYRDDK